MPHRSSGAGAIILRLIVALALLAWPRVGLAQGTWSVISLTGESGEIDQPYLWAVDAAGNLYVADYGVGRFLKWDTQGNWSVVANVGYHLGEVGYPSVVAADPEGNLYVADGSLDDGNNRIQKRDAQGNWSVIAGRGFALGSVLQVSALAVDRSGNLYVADHTFDRISARTTDHRIQKRDAQDNWSVIATEGTALGQVNGPTALAVDGAGNLYVADYDESTGRGRIQKRDAQGNWSLIATNGSALGQVDGASGLAVDGAGNLYVADTGNHRVQMYTPAP